MKFAVISVCFVVWTACVVDDKGLDWGDARPYHFVCKWKRRFTVTDVNANVLALTDDPKLLFF